MKYSELVEVYEQLDSTTKRLEKTFIIAKFLIGIPKESLPELMLLLEGKVFPDWDDRKIGVAAQIVVKAIAQASGDSLSHVEKTWKHEGDLGQVAQVLIGSKKQFTLAQTELTPTKVLHNIQKLAQLDGTGSVNHKLQLIVELLSSASGVEAKYLVRTLVEQLRIGAGSGTLRDSLCWAFFPVIDKVTDGRLAEFKRGKHVSIDSMPNLSDLHGVARITPATEQMGRDLYNSFLDKIQGAYDLSNDWGTVAKAAAIGLSALEKIEMHLGIPLKVMLALKVASIDEAFEKVGVPLIAEYKYDGFRIQAHRDGEKIWLFTRRLENVTEQFPDVVRNLREHVSGDEYILDMEVVGFDPKTSHYLPFQKISQRIRRKYNIEEMERLFPVEMNVFDVISYGGKNLTGEPLSRRREIVERIIKSKKRVIVPAHHIVSSSKDEVLDFFKESLAAGNEGIMIKKMDAPYQPGARVGHMVKFKPTMETLDLVIVGAQWGEGKRSEWLSSFILACRKGHEFVEIGRVGTGFKEKEDEDGVSFSQLTELLVPLIISEDGMEVRVKPKIVIEVRFEEIQKSLTYSSGYALRFPRLYRLREDRGPHDCSSIDDVERLFKTQ